VRGCGKRAVGWRGQESTIEAQSDTITALKASTSQLQKQVRCASCRPGEAVQNSVLHIDYVCSVRCDSNCRKRNVCRWCDASVLDASNAQAERTDAKLEEQVGPLKLPTNIFTHVEFHSDTVCLESVAKSAYYVLRNTYYVVIRKARNTCGMR
jgi:hypothetical protein